MHASRLLPPSTPQSHRKTTVTTASPSFRRTDSFPSASSAMKVTSMTSASGGSILSGAPVQCFTPGSAESVRSLALGGGGGGGRSHSTPSALAIRITRSQHRGAIDGGSSTVVGRAGGLGGRSANLSTRKPASSGIGASSPGGGTKRNARGGAKRLSFTAADAARSTGLAAAAGAGCKIAKRGTRSSSSKTVDGGGAAGVDNSVGGGGGGGDFGKRGAKRARKSEDYVAASKAGESGGGSRKKKRPRESSAIAVAPEDSAGAATTAGSAADVTVPVTGAVGVDSRTLPAPIDEAPQGRSASGAEKSTTPGCQSNAVGDRAGGKPAAAAAASAVALAKKHTPTAGVRKTRVQSRIAKAFAAPSLFGGCSRPGAFGESVARTPHRSHSSAATAGMGRDGWKDDGKGKGKGRSSSGAGTGSGRRGAKEGRGGGQVCRLAALCRNCSCHQARHVFRMWSCVIYRNVCSTGKIREHLRFGTSTKGYWPVRFHELFFYLFLGPIRKLRTTIISASVCAKGNPYFIKGDTATIRPHCIVLRSILSCG